MPTIIRSIAASLILASAAAAQSAPAAAQPSPIPDPDPNQKLETITRVVAPTDAQPSAPGQINTADDLLNALENAGKDLRTFQASLRKIKFLGELQGNDTQEQDGRLIFVSEPQPDKDGKPQPARRKFEVQFEFIIFNGKTKKDDHTAWIFDGEWLTERNPEAKQIHRRQVVPPGQTMDPLAVGEGPFPLPIGQKKARILERFSAELLPPDKFDHFQGGKFPGEALSETWQLRLTPRPEFKRDMRLTEARIWYRKGDLLPRMAWTADKDGSSDEYLLISMQENQPLPDGAFDTTAQPGWVVQTDEFRREKDGKKADK